MKTLISWSSGKDSAWMLHLLRQDPRIELVGLFCTVNEAFDRVAMHGVRVDLLKQQAKSANLPLHLIHLPHPCTNNEYITIMRAFINEAKQKGIESFAFGDLFLREVRTYRETLLYGTGIRPLFPLWGMPTKSLSKQMIAAGLKAIITCVDPKQISADFAGREYNESFLNDLSRHIDPCGENGEFHSFAVSGPMFQTPIPVSVGETIHRDGFYFTDLLACN